MRWARTTRKLIVSHRFRSSNPDHSSQIGALSSIQKVAVNPHEKVCHLAAIILRTAASCGAQQRWKWHRNKCKNVKKWSKLSHTNRLTGKQLNAVAQRVADATFQGLVYRLRFLFGTWAGYRCRPTVIRRLKFAGPRGLECEVA
jgi:hypothetical protein